MAFRVIWMVWMGCVIAGSVAPEPLMLEAELYVPLLGLGDKFLHFIGYCGLAFLATLSFHRRNRATVAALSMIALGAGVEFAQMFSPTRTTEWSDVAANTAGVLCGMMAGLLLRPFAHPTPPAAIERPRADVGLASISTRNHSVDA
jgi:hypothetical protein